MRRLLLLVLVLAVSVSAANFQVSVFPTERTIKTNETAMFDVELKDTLPVDDVFEMYSSDVTWDIRTNDILRSSAGQSVKTILQVHPLNLNPGAYNLPITFKRTSSSDELRVMLYVELVSPAPADTDYLPAVRGMATIERQIDPRSDVVMKLSLENQNRKSLERVDVKVRSSVINKDYNTSLGSLEKKTLTFIAQVDPKTPPQNDTLQISLVVPSDGQAYVFDVLPVLYEIKEYGGIISNISESSSFLKWSDVVTITNNGNKHLSYSYRVPAWFAKRWFIAASPSPHLESSELVWDVDLAQGASATIAIVYNVRPLLWVVLLVVVGVGAYYFFRSPIVMYKRAKVIGAHEGGITELKVVVELVNRSRKTAKTVRILDLVPHLADVVKEVHDGVLAPSKVAPHEQRGTLVRWDIDFMEGKEHRILMYRIKTKLSVLGGLTLPVAGVHFTVEGHEWETISNRPQIRM